MDATHFTLTHSRFVIPKNDARISYVVIFHRSCSTLEELRDNARNLLNFPHSHIPQ